MSRAEEAATWAKAESLRAALVEMGGLLAPVGVELLVIKGVYLAHAVAPTPLGRTMIDADAIVVSGSFDRAVEVIQRGGWKTVCDDWSTKGFAHSSTGAFIDLHRLPLPPLFGAVRRESLRARSRISEAVFGPHVRIPDPLDAACIAIANHVKDCAGAKAHGRLASDLRLLAERASMTPTSLGERLREHGLRRIALVAFASLANAPSEPKRSEWLDWLEALAPSHAERRASVWLAEWIVRMTPRRYALAFLGVRSIADSWPRALAGFSVTAARLGRDRVRPYLPTRQHRWLRGAL
jgi:hypothetical protein